MMSTVDIIITGVIAIGVITAFGIHAADLSKIAGATGPAVSGIMGTTERG